LAISNPKLSSLDYTSQLFTSDGYRGGAQGSPLPLLWVKKIAEGRKAGRATKNNWAPTLA